jgi:acyl-coenzyme A thioesterase PaaI-like protein
LSSPSLRNLFCFVRDRKPHTTRSRPWVDFLRPGRGKHFIATGRVVRMRSRIAVPRMALEDDDAELIATGSAAYVVG